MASDRWPTRCLYFGIGGGEKKQTECWSTASENHRLPATIATRLLNVNCKAVLSLEQGLTCVNGTTSTWSWQDSRQDFTDLGCHRGCKHKHPAQGLPCNARLCLLYLNGQPSGSSTVGRRHIRSSLVS